MGNLKKPTKERFEKFIEMIIEEGNWCYYDCTPMTEDAIAFLEHYKQVVTAWETVSAMTENTTVIAERKRG